MIADAPVHALHRELKERLSSFKVPTRWLVAGDAGAVPLLASGKVDKGALQRLLASDGVPPAP